jgi:predicted methyltransferase
VVHLARQYVRQRENAKGADCGGNVLTGDMRQLCSRLDDDSVDLILSDPPYADLGAYSRLAELAAAKLKPGGVCVAYSGTMTLPTTWN